MEMRSHEVAESIAQGKTLRKYMQNLLSPERAKD
jgi:hypothetical protein